MKFTTLTVALAAWLTSSTVTAEMFPNLSDYLNPSRNQEIGLTYEAFLSPHQEGGEESDVPPQASSHFLSTEPSQTRDEREAEGHRGHALVRFNKDLSRAYVDVKLEGVNTSASSEIVMFHLHCGRPGVLGPIIIDFSLAADASVTQTTDGSILYSVEVSNKDITDNIALSSNDTTSAFSRGCLIPSLTLDSLKTTTIAGMAYIAEEGDLYFNVHTKGQTYYGDMRGQLYPISSASGHSRSLD
jgi:hypothetical protein